MEPTIITDDVECMRILTDEGLLDKLRPWPGFTHVNTAFQYAGCWCLATYDCGHSDPKDNGYTIVMLPDSSTTLDEAAKFFSEAINGVTHGVRIGVEFTVQPLEFA